MRNDSLKPASRISSITNNTKSSTSKYCKPFSDIRTYEHKSSSYLKQFCNKNPKDKAFTTRKTSSPASLTAFNNNNSSVSDLVKLLMEQS